MPGVRSLAAQWASADRVVYVSTTGNDLHDGRSPGSAFATLAAADAALGVNGGQIILGGGTHVVSSITFTRNNIALIGLGRRSTVLSFSSGAGVHFDGSASSIRYALVRDLHIVGNGQAFDGLKFTNGVECLMDNITVSNFGGYALNVSGGGSTFYMNARSSTFSGCGNGARVTGQLANFNACRFQGNTTLGVEDYSNAGAFYGCAFEGNGVGGVNTSQNGGKSFSACYWESNGSYQFKSIETKGLTITGGRAYSGASPTDIGFDLGRSTGSVPENVSLRGVHFLGPHTTAAIRLNRVTADIDCYFDGETTTVLTL